MPQCKKCGRKGLLLKLEGKTGLCLSCNAEFAESGKHLTEKIMDNVNLIAQSDDPNTIVSRCDQIEESANKLILLQEAYSLEPSSELVDLVSKYREMKQKALNAMQK